MILSGCGHAGIVNTVRYARKLTGNDAVAAIIGGFHLKAVCEVDDVVRHVAAWKVEEIQKAEHEVAG